MKESNKLVLLCLPYERSKKGMEFNMKSEKGVTLISLIIYVIAMLITITIISVMTGYFYKNIDISTEKYSYLGEYTKFNSYLSEEVNEEGNKILEVISYSNSDEENNSKQRYIAFSSKNQYTYIPSNKAIYQNNVKIASGVENCEFKEIIENGKEAVQVTLKIGEFEKTVTYVLKI